MDKVSYERRGSTAAADDRAARAAQRGRRRDRRASCSRASARFEADDEARVMVLTGAGDVAFCAGADLKALAEVGPRPPAELVEEVAGRTRGPDGLHPADREQADDRRDQRLVPGGRARAGALVRPADRDRGARSSATPSGAGASR